MNTDCNNNTVSGCEDHDDPVKQDSNHEDGAGARAGSGHGNGPSFTSCCFVLSSPAIFLRNMLLPSDMWRYFPEGITCYIIFIKLIYVML